MVCAVTALEDLRADLEGGRRVLVPHLCLHVRDGRSGLEHQPDEGAADGVRGHRRGRRRFPAISAQRVCGSDSRCDHAAIDVVLVSAAPSLRRERRIGRLRVRTCGPIRDQPSRSHGVMFTWRHRLPSWSCGRGSRRVQSQGRRCSPHTPRCCEGRRIRAWVTFRRSCRSVAGLLCRSPRLSASFSTREITFSDMLTVRGPGARRGCPRRSCSVNPVSFAIAIS